MGGNIRGELSLELGFLKRDRDTTINRQAFIAGELTRVGTAAIVAPIVPYNETSKQACKTIEKSGGFYLVHVATPLDECIKPERDGVHEKAKKGEIKEFTGVDDPYEVPQDVDLVVDITKQYVSRAVHEIVLLLEKMAMLALLNGF